ncbi:MAG TPA: septal ring lytic transglycosylase RlpA family protein [Chitinophagales bacterium]|nr:septal ring lytic transglycosylase RlpA family protein [Chitinophagales bacterium]HPH89038.1 septal ring lytic transglycosylase RlpA family protein [Chitinophagales bacterium]
MKKILVIILTIHAFCALSAQTEFGVASYYGTYFHGRPTASGEKYNQFALTAAHKTLPLGTVVKVTNAQNNKSVYVKVNDRGPFVKGRVIDLSTKAAELLGYRNKGTAYVKIEVVNKDEAPADLMDATLDIAAQNGIKEYDSTASSATVSEFKTWKDIPTVNDEKTKSDYTVEKDDSPEPQPAIEIKEANSNGLTNRSPYFIVTRLDKSKTGFYGLQLGVFSDMNVIFAIIAELEAKYNQTLLVEQMDLNGKTVYKLFIGKFQNRAYADALKSTLSDKYKDAFVTKYE